MLKEKRNQGMIALVVITAFFAIAGIVSLFMLYSDSNPSAAYAGDGTNSDNSTVYVDVYNISEQAVIEVDDNTEVWLIQYKDGYTGLQAKKNDSQIADILKKAQNGDLAKNPVRVVGKYIGSHSKTKEKIGNYSSLITSVGNDFDGVNSYLAHNTYVSISEFQSGNSSYIFMAVFTFGIGIFFLVMGIIGRKRNIAAYEEIYAAYPEVKDNLNLLIENANFHDDVLKIIIYKHHLITYYNGFKAVDLTETVQLYHHILTMRRGFIATNRNSSLVAVRPNKKNYQMPIKNINKTTDSKLQSTFDYIYNNFPHIKLGI